MEQYDLIVIGGGVIGCACARAAANRFPSWKILLLERERALAQHQSGRNSGVIHAGYNQKPRTMKAKFVVEGNRRLRAFCAEYGVPMIQNGILVVAQNEREEKTNSELYARGIANGAEVSIIGNDELHSLEPHVTGVSALHAPEASSFDAPAYVSKLADLFKSASGSIQLAENVIHCEETGTHVKVRTNERTLLTKLIVNAGGLLADRIAHTMGLGMSCQIVPFRGEYYELERESRCLVNGHIYAVPDLDFPFLRVHFSRTAGGAVTIGPGAVLAMGRHAYSRSDLDIFDVIEMIRFQGFWRMFANSAFRRMAKDEWRKSLFKGAVYQQARQLIPELRIEQMIGYRSGIRAQLINGAGELVDDVVVEESPRSVHVLNAVSPALTCSLPFADYIVDLLCQKI